MWRGESKIKSKQEKMNYKYFIAGTIIAIAGGIFGNMFVTSMYRVIDGNPRGHNLLTVILGFVGFILIIWIAFNKLKKN